MTGKYEDGSRGQTLVLVQNLSGSAVERTKKALTLSDFVPVTCAGSRQDVANTIKSDGDAFASLHGEMIQETSKPNHCALSVEAEPAFGRETDHSR